MKQSYSLANPITSFLDKPASDFTRADLVKVIEEMQLDKITFHYTGIDGKYKELRLPVTNRYQAEYILAEGERVDGSSLFKGLVDTSVSDLYVVPLYKSAFLNPFDPGSLDFTCRYLTKDGEMAPFALDTILFKASERFKKTTGMELKAFGELEFFLLQDKNDESYNIPAQQSYHASAPFLKSGDILNDIMLNLAQITGAVKYAHSEVGSITKARSNLSEIKGKAGEQVEIEFLPVPIDEAGDILVLSRWLIRNIAYQNGYVATFTPKIEEGIAGNGMHVHLSVVKEGKNVINNEAGELSETAKKLIGGLCKYAQSLTAFGNTVSSAYLRLVPDQEAPTKVCWSDLNRSTMIRVPLGWTNSENLAFRVNPQQVDSFEKHYSKQTVEFRSPDGSAIIYLLLAGIAVAAEWGLTNPEALELTRDLYVAGNIFKDKDLLSKLPSLPSSCVESADILLKHREDYEINGIFPPSVIDYVARLLRAEKDEDINRYLIEMPADDRLSEVRKIMHKDLHRH